MKKLSLKKLNRPNTAEGVNAAVAEEGFIPLDETREGVTLMTVFKGRERHTRRRKKADGTRVKLQSYTGCEGAEDKIFIAVSRDGAGRKKKCRHISCDIYVKGGYPHGKKDLY